MLDSNIVLKRLYISWLMYIISFSGMKVLIGAEDNEQKKWE